MWGLQVSHFICRVRVLKESETSESSSRLALSAGTGDPHPRPVTPGKPLSLARGARHRQLPAPPASCHHHREGPSASIPHRLLYKAQQPSQLISSNNKTAIKTSRIPLYWGWKKFEKKTLCLVLKGEKDLHYSHANICHLFHHFPLESPC